RGPPRQQRPPRRARERARLQRRPPEPRRQHGAPAAPGREHRRARPQRRAAGAHRRRHQPPRRARHLPRQPRGPHRCPAPGRQRLRLHLPVAPPVPVDAHRPHPRRARAALHARRGRQPPRLRPFLPLGRRGEGAVNRKILALALAVIVLAGVWTLAPLWAPLLLSAWTAELVRPLARRLERFSARPVAAGIVIALLLIVLVPLSFAVASLVVAAIDAWRQVSERPEVQGSLLALVSDGGN